jgi:hypothetical protein
MDRESFEERLGALIEESLAGLSPEEKLTRLRRAEARIRMERADACIALYSNVVRKAGNQ